MRSAAWSFILPPLAACASALPDSPPPLRDMEEPLELFQEPDDETERTGLGLGGFTGAYVGDARGSLDALLGEAEGVEVVRIVENSPADAAGIVVGDVLLEARVGDDAPRALRYPSDWRAVELACDGDVELRVVVDRANRRATTTLRPVPRLRPLVREEAIRVREEGRVGIVVRTATEVEARAVGLAPGAGAVVVGLSKRSPWRVAGIAFGDLITAIDDREIAHPEVVVEAIRNAGDTARVKWVREGEMMESEASMSARAADFRELFIPILLSHESGRGESDTSVLLGMFRHESTAVAWRFRLLWFIWFGGGDADELLEVDG